MECRRLEIKIRRSVVVSDVRVEGMIMSGELREQRHKII